MKRLVYQLRTEGEGAGRDGWAIGLGILVGCLPVYGLHLALCWVLGRGFGLNRLKMYLAANISNPFVAPALLFSEIQIGAWLRRGAVHPLSVDAVRQVSPWSFGADLAIGSVVLGSALGGLLGFLTWAMTRGRDADPAFADLVRRASDRYLASGITAWEFARGKMRGDPLYRMVLAGGVLPSGGTLVDVGCGQGLMLALLVEAARGGATAAPTSRVPGFDTLIGIELRPRIAALARRALGSEATIIEGDVRDHTPGGCRAVLFFDVLHLMPPADQESLLFALEKALASDGVMVVREADAGAGRMFTAVRWGNRLKALAVGRWSQTFHFRSHPEWTALFEAAGFDVAANDASAGTPFGNVLYVLTRPRRGSA
jgi:SAM-dependent methyltransferase